MFLNLHSNYDKGLGHEPNFVQEKSYISSFSKLNKQKSYSSSCLKQEFRQFKNKSLSHKDKYQSSLTQHKLSNFLFSKTLQKPPIFSYKPTSFLRNGVQNGRNLKINNLKKSYLNVDSKLNKCSKPKDYFKPIRQIKQIFQPDASYAEPQKILQRQHIRKSIRFDPQIEKLQRQNQTFRRQNQELKRQRAVDIDLICRQNQIMQKQEQLIEAIQRDIKTRKVEQKFIFQTIDKGSYKLNNHQKDQVQKNKCQEFKEKIRQNTGANKFFELTIQKHQEEKRMLKNYIHELVYQCQKYKQDLKKLEQNYLKQLKQNQKLIAIIQNSDQLKQKEQIKNNRNSINQQPYLNSQSKEQFLGESVPVSIKRQKRLIFPYRDNVKGENIPIDSPNIIFAKKMNKYRTTANLLNLNQQLKGIDLTCESNIACEKKNQKNQQKFVECKQQIKSEYLSWSPNPNILKYLEQINQQKTNQIDKIDFLLSNL